MPANGLHLHPTSFEGWFFTAYAGAIVVLLALPWAFNCIRKRRDYLPLLALCAGAITSLGEPMLDHVGHLRWANNLPGPAFSNFGLHIPALIPPCYMLFMGLEAYWIYTMIQRGINKRQFMWMGAAVGLSDAIMEHPGLAMHTYEYYGNQPFKDGLFPFYWAFTNAVAICTIAVLIHFVWPSSGTRAGCSWRSCRSASSAPRWASSAPASRCSWPSTPTWPPGCSGSSAR